MNGRADGYGNPLWPLTASVQMIRGSFNIVDHWACLKKAGFKDIDTALMIPQTTPGPKKQTWFFSGSKCIRAEWEISKSPFSSI
jgi:hypothetical protein